MSLGSPIKKNKWNIHWKKPIISSFKFFGNVYEIKP